MIFGEPTVGCDILSAMDGLTQFYLFKERLLEREPIALGHFVVDLRERHLDYWTPYSDIHQTKAQQQTLHLPSIVCPPYQEGPSYTFTTHPS